MNDSDLEKHFRAMEGLNSPHQRLYKGLESLLIAENLELTLKNEILEKIPKRWERYGELVLLPKKTFKEYNGSKFLNQSFWKVIAKALEVSKIGIQGEIKGDYRETGAFLVLGNNANVLHVENKIIYSFNVTKCMFSSGNVSERIRVSKFDCTGEEILDLYAGIGYYTLPLLVYSGCKHVYSCEWNEEASDSLIQNLSLNKVEDKCSVYVGDNNITITDSKLIGKIDRVFLGLLPSSKGGWKLGLSSLKSTGGMIHLHGNAPGKKELEWAKGVMKELSELALEMNKKWKFSLQHLEKVKWYSPHVRHVVLDILCERDE